MVERILSGAARVLEDGGYQDASTNRIAREAGISPGSLYQYFPDKDAIVAEITHRLIDDFAGAIAPALRAAATEQPPAAVLTVLGSVLDALQQHAALLRALVDRVPAIEQQEALQSVRSHIADIVYHTLAANSRALRHADVQRMTWTIVELTQHLLVRYVLDSPPIEREDFLADTAHIVLSLAYGSSVPGGRGSAS
ncbi:MAG TPA: TetR/AcrR family transcriptional regulator [Solirubrobacteraceae bacterium]|jgi:AcrR family transcriptional regulator